MQLAIDRIAIKISWSHKLAILAIQQKHVQYEVCHLNLISVSRRIIVLWICCRLPPNLFFHGAATNPIKVSASVFYSKIVHLSFMVLVLDFEVPEKTHDSIVCHTHRLRRSFSSTSNHKMSSRRVMCLQMFLKLFHFSFLAQFLQIFFTQKDLLHVGTLLFLHQFMRPLNISEQLTFV